MTFLTFGNRIDVSIRWGLLDQIVVSGVNFASGIMLARFLGLAQYGIFVLAWLWVLFASSVHQALIIAPMMSLGPKNGIGESPKYVGALFSHHLIFATGAAGATVLFGVAGSWAQASWRQDGVIVPLAVTVGTFLTQDFLRRYFFAIQAFRSAFVLDAICYIGQLAIVVVLYWQNALTVVSLLYAISLASGISFVLCMMGVGRLEFSMTAVTSSARKHWGFSKWLAATSLLQWLSGNFYIITAGSILGSSAVGAIKAAQNILGICHVLFLALENVAPVKAARLLQMEGGASLMRYIQRLLWVGGLLTVALALVLSAFPAELLSIVYGNADPSSIAIMRWLSAMYVLVYLALPLRMALRTLEATRPIFLAYLATSLFTLASAAWLVEVHGVVGAVIGMLACQVVTVAIYAFSLIKANSSLKPPIAGTDQQGVAVAGGTWNNEDGDR